ncbi:hypothetical protein BG004_003070 [Podila humilis]|nr:hypothetical protein BG004_003070 [Podila humilis]
MEHLKMGVPTIKNLLHQCYEMLMYYQGIDITLKLMNCFLGLLNPSAPKQLQMAMPHIADLRHHCHEILMLYIESIDRALQELESLLPWIYPSSTAKYLMDGAESYLVKFKQSAQAASDHWENGCTHIPVFASKHLTIFKDGLELLKNLDRVQTWAKVSLGVVIAFSESLEDCFQRMHGERYGRGP